jgi:hypothetical protein
MHSLRDRFKLHRTGNSDPIVTLLAVARVREKHGFAFHPGSD